MHFALIFSLCSPIFSFNILSKKVLLGETDNISFFFRHTVREADFWKSGFHLAANMSINTCAPDTDSWHAICVPLLIHL